MREPRMDRRILIAAALISIAQPSCKGKAPGGKEGPTEEDIAAMKEECGRIMPKTFADVWIGMTEEDLKKARPEAAYQAQRTDPDERRWYTETSETGVRVWYGFDRPTSRLAVVQFAHKFLSWDVFRTHAAALQDRFGTAYQLYQCPAATGGQNLAMTRLLWARQPVAIEEAVLEMGGSISVTMLVAGLEDLRKGIDEQACVMVDREKAMDSWLEENLAKEQESIRKSAKHGHGIIPPEGYIPDGAQRPPEAGSGEGGAPPPPAGGE